MVKVKDYEIGFILAYPCGTDVITLREAGGSGSGDAMAQAEVGAMWLLAKKGRQSLVVAKGTDPLLPRVSGKDNPLDTLILDPCTSSLFTSVTVR